MVQQNKNWNAQRVALTIQSILARKEFAETALIIHVHLRNTQSVLREGENNATSIYL